MFYYIDYLVNYNWSQTKQSVVLGNLCGAHCNVSAETINQELSVTPDCISLHKTFLLGSFLKRYL